ncbi:MAG: molybdopterin converting factor subunit 1 [Cyclobacteriaceae bacterium]|nr:molybdopterin converting factor subunit 1 [Cyclobacteriaceae bacterium]
MQIVTVNILFFGITKDLAGKQRMQMQLPAKSTVADFKKALYHAHPALISMNSMAVAVNSEYAFDDQLIEENDEIALIPPVSGG